MYQPIVNELVYHISAHPLWREAFDKAIETAKEKASEDFKFIPDLGGFYDFMDSLQTWVPFEKKDARYVYKQLCTFYFVFDQPEVYKFQSKIEPGTGGEILTYLSDWLVRYAKAIGAFMDTPESLTPMTLQTFYEAEDYHMDVYLEPPGGWKTFNEFFARKIKPELRPIGDGIISPADSTYEGQWPIDENSRITLKNFEWSISELLQDTRYGDKFAGGTFMHSFLTPQDYHRMHAPVGGKVLETKLIEGQVYLEVVAINGRVQPVRGLKPRGRGIIANDSEGYQFCQMRGLIVLETEIGLVAVLPIGMAHVSSVIFTAREGETLQKGDEIAYFQFGGSDIVMLFEASADVKITATPDHHYNMGEQLDKADPVVPLST